MNDTPFIRVPKSLVDTGLLAQLSPAAVKVYLAIASHVDCAGLAWPSQSRLGRLSGIGRQRANNAVRELCALGLIDHQAKTNVYHVAEMRHPLSPTDDTPCRANATPTRTIEPDPINNSDEQKEAAAALVKEGFKSEEIARLISIASDSPARVSTAIANADRLQAQNKLRNRGGYIRKAIEQNYPPVATSPSAGTYRPEAPDLKRSRDERVEESRRQSQAERSAAEMLEMQITNTIDSLSDERLSELKARFLATLPPASQARLADKNPRTSPILRGAIHAMVSGGESPRSAEKR